MSWVFFLSFQVYKTCYKQLHLKIVIHNAQAFSKYMLTSKMRQIDNLNGY